MKTQFAFTNRQAGETDASGTASHDVSWATVGTKFGPTIRVPKVFVDARLTIRGAQVRVPRSKRRRIRAKWAKQRKNYATIPDPNIYGSDAGGFVCHPCQHVRLAQYLQDNGWVYLHPSTFIGA